jgi:hypothetical protein
MTADVVSQPRIEQVMTFIMHPHFIHPPSHITVKIIVEKISFIATFVTK